MKMTFAVFLFCAFGVSNAAWAAEAPSEATQHSFEDLLIQGKYHFSDEAVTTVEEDKVLDSLIGVRTDFKDRLEQSAERY
jgi:hypothetical protein